MLQSLMLSYLVQTSHVGLMEADYGGTETPQALESAFASRGLDRPAVVFLLTDGAIHVGPKIIHT